MADKQIQAEQEKKSFSLKRFFCFLVKFANVVVLLVVVGVFAIGVTRERMLSDTLNKQSETINHLEKQVEDAQKLTQQTQKELADFQALYEQDQKESLALATDEQHTIFVEMTRIIQQAQEQVLRGNVAIAQQLLASAQIVLVQLNDDTISAIKSTLEEDITLLGKYAQQRKVYLQTLHTLSQEVRDLVWKTKRGLSAPKDISKETTASVWEKIIDSAKQLVIIRRHDTQATPLLSEEKFQLWQQRTLLYLDQMQWAFLQNDKALYQQLLYQFQESLGQVYRLISEEQRHVISDKVEKIKVLPESPQLKILSTDSQFKVVASSAKEEEEKNDENVN